MDSYINTHDNFYEQLDYVSHLSVLLPVRLQAVIFCSFWFWEGGNEIVKKKKKIGQSEKNKN